MKIYIDKENCIGCGSCAALAANTFELSDEGKATVRDENGDNAETVLSAAKACPVSVITVSDDKGKQLWPEA